MTLIVDGPSLWDAPPGCTPGSVTERSQAIAILRLTRPQASVILTTVNPGTNFDTTLYVLPGCGNVEATPLGCVDDTPNSALATLELITVSPGTDTVVVDSFSLGGVAALTASTQ